MDIRALSLDDVEAMWAINEEGLPGTGQVSRQELATLLDLSSLSLGAFEGENLLGFVLCLPPRTSYGSLNYAWFNQRYDAFLYVDRIAVAHDHRNQGVGSALTKAYLTYSTTQLRNCLLTPRCGLGADQGQPEARAQAGGQEPRRQADSEEHQQVRSKK